MAISPSTLNWIDGLEVLPRVGSEWEGWRAYLASVERLGAVLLKREKVDYTEHDGQGIRW